MNNDWYEMIMTIWAVPPRIAGPDLHKKANNDEKGSGQHSSMVLYQFLCLIHVLSSLN